jgi:hypothetical protein
MATETRHAAWQTGRSFAVRLLTEQAPPADLASGLPDFLDAVDFAFDWLNREDPARDGAARLAIFATRDGVTEEVWTYPAARRGDDQELVDVFGFDPVTWVPGVREFAGRESRRPLARRVTATVSHPHVVPDVDDPPEAAPPTVEHAPEPKPAPVTAPAPTAEQPVARPEPVAVPVDLDPESVESPERAPVRAIARRWLETTARREWADPVSRCCLVFAGVALWLSVSLADPSFLALLLVSIPGLWWRRRVRAAAPAETDADDWL